MSTPSLKPLDYRTYSAICDQADALVRKTGTGTSTRTTALLALARAYPDDPRYAVALRTATRRAGQQAAPARDVVTKAAPAPSPPSPSFAALVQANMDLGMNPDQAWAMAKLQSPAAYDAFRSPGGAAPAAVQKQVPASLPPSATDTLMEAIATRQAEEPGLSVVEALDAVHKAAPELYDQYVRDSRYPHLRGQPMPTQADPAPSYAQVMKAVDERVAKSQGVTRRDALIALVQEHPHEQAYHEAYRQYHLTDGLKDRA